jgi:hypothetical protein
MEFFMKFHGKIFMKKNPSDVDGKFHGIPCRGIPWN